MGCNCKRVTNLEEEYGVKQEETVLGKWIKFAMKVAIYPIVLLIALILIPFYFIVFSYKIVFSNNMRAPLPKFMSKYLK